MEAWTFKIQNGQINYLVRIQSRIQRKYEIHAVIKNRLCNTIFRKTQNLKKEQ